MLALEDSEDSEDACIDGVDGTTGGREAFSEDLTLQGDEVELLSNRIATANRTYILRNAHSSQPCLKPS